MQDGIERIRNGAEAAGRDAARIEIAPFVNVVVSANREAARDQARLPLAYYIGGMGDYYRESLSRLGFAEESSRVYDLWRSGRPREAIRAITNGMVEAVAICGPIEHCLSRLNEVYSAGATLVLVPIPSEGTTSEKCALIESLARWRSG